MQSQVIPIFRIFDYTKAIEFYIQWLGFSIDWEHTFEPGAPRYIQISRDGIVLHLTEHHGDCTPGSKALIRYSGLRAYHQQLIDKNYVYNRPGLEEAPWNSLTMTVTDPFGNKLFFNEPHTS
jgi:uncharacterized glyoxalase superfamily protein PhnB